MEDSLLLHGAHSANPLLLETPQYSLVFAVSKATTVSHKPIKLLKNVPISPHRSQPDQSQSCHDETSREENNEGSVMEFADDRTDVDLPQAETVDEFSNLQKSDAITESPTDLDDLMDDIARLVPE